VSIKGYFLTIIGSIFAAFIVVGGMASANAEPVTPTAPVTTQAVICDPSECDQDEGETISADEMAELYRPIVEVKTTPANQAEPAAPKAAPAEPATVPAPVVTEPAVAPAAAPRIEEDEPGWDCHTMGNKVCGPAATPVAPLPACVTDEAEPGIAPCYWDAANRGNGLGHSFIWDGQNLTYTS
jgi:hypothetical protein